MAGNFFATSEEIRLEDGHILRARLQRIDGEWVDAEINLNDHIGNENGMSHLFLFMTTINRIVIRPLCLGECW